LRKSAANVPGLEAAVADGNNAYQALQAEAKALRDAVANLEASLAATTKENLLAEEEIDALKQRCTASAVELAAAQQARTNDAAQIAALQKAVARLEASLKKSDEHHSAEAADAEAMRTRIAQQELRISVRTVRVVSAPARISSSPFPSVIFM